MDAPDGSPLAANPAPEATVTQLPLPREPESTATHRGPTFDLATLDQRLLGLSEQEKVRILREALRPIVGGNANWIARLGDACDHYQIALPGVRSLCADLSWQARSEGQSYPSDVPSYTPSPDGIGALVAAYAEAYRLRYDFHFEALNQASVDWLQRFPADALILSFAAFASLGSRQPQGIDLYQEALASPNADRRSRHTCLAGMWLAFDLPDQPRYLLELSSTMMAKGETDNNVFYRRAGALRRLGRYQEAIEDIDRAISLLGVGDNLVHQDYVRERELIVSALNIHSTIEGMGASLRESIMKEASEQIELASAQLAARVDDAQRVISDGLLKIVEILGLFVALIGFIAGTGTLALKASSFGSRALSMGLVLAGSLIFFVLLRLVTSYRRNRSR